MISHKWCKLLSGLAAVQLVGCDEPLPTEPETPTIAIPAEVALAASAVSSTDVAIVDLGPGVAFAVNNRGDVAFHRQGEVSVWRNGDVDALGGPPGSPEAINERGDVVGRAFGEHAYLWSAGAVIPLGTLGGGASWAFDINNRGQVVGWSQNAGGYHRAFLWVDGQMEDLGTLGGYQSWAYGLNNSGAVVGGAWTATGYEHAFLWTRGSMTDLGTLDGGSSSESRANAINDRGQVVGRCEFGSFRTVHACRWQRGEVLDLGTLGGQYSYAYDIADNGKIVGISSIPGEHVLYHAFVWADGEMRDLGTLGGCCSYAYGVNSRGEVAGYAWDANSIIHAVVWRP